MSSVVQALKNEVATEADYSRAPSPVHAPVTDKPRNLVCGPDEELESPYPVYMQGEVIRGFGRGSKELGCPTANLPEEAIAPYKTTLKTGVHFGYAQVAFTGQEGSSSTSPKHDAVLPMVMSIGWNPYYKNEKRTAEVHVLHQYPHDFYGQHLKIAILGFVRPEYNYTSLDALVADIELDKESAFKSLDRPAYRSYQQDAYFS